MFQAVADNVRLRCKCHGVSGSCEVRTCWRTVPSMRHVGTWLLNKYDVAAQVACLVSCVTSAAELFLLTRGIGSVD